MEQKDESEEEEKTKQTTGVWVALQERIN